VNTRQLAVIIRIKANKEKFHYVGLEAAILYRMGNSPRKIGQIVVNVRISLLLTLVMVSFILMIGSSLY